MAARSVLEDTSGLLDVIHSARGSLDNIHNLAFPPMRSTRLRCPPPLFITYNYPLLPHPLSRTQCPTSSERSAVPPASLPRSYNDVKIGPSLLGVPWNLLGSSGIFLECSFILFIYFLQFRSSLEHLHLYMVIFHRFTADFPNAFAQRSTHRRKCSPRSSKRPLWEFFRDSTVSVGILLICSAP